jgi:ATP-binding cassette subfamily B protein
VKPWWLRLSRYAIPHWRGLSFSAVLMLAGVGLDVLKPWPMKLLVDHALTGQPLPRAAAWILWLPGQGSPGALLAWLTIATILLFLAGWTSRIIQSYVQAGVGSRMVYELGADLFSHLQGLSLRFHGRRPTGDLVKRVTTDSSCVRDLVMGVFVPLLTSSLSLITMFAVMWRLDRSLSLVALVAAPLLALLIRIFAGPMEERTYRRLQLEGEMMSAAEQTLRALPIVQVFGREQREDERFSSLCRRTGQAYLRAVNGQLGFQIGASSVTALGTAVVMLIGGWHVLQGSLSVGSLLVFLAYLGSLYGPLESLAYLSSGFTSAAASARRVLEIRDTQEGVQDVPGARPLPPRPAGQPAHVRFEKVVFGYEPGRPVLHHIDLEIQPGESLAFVGPTGAGKSTLASLLPRFFDPWEGRVLLDGIDIRGVQLASLRSCLAIVLQEPFLFALPVADNIAYGRPGATRAEVEAAAVTANADEFIRDLPSGYDTVIGERGATLSGGQRQRIAIARALLKDAPILILDEPTSALDTQTEWQVLEAMERLMQGRTTIIIAHRLSTVQRANRIVVLADGRIVETGTHEALLRLRGVYQRLYSLQFNEGSVPRAGEPISVAELR